jgi:DnaB-like helicase N terminal domain
MRTFEQAKAAFAESDRRITSIMMSRHGDAEAGDTIEFIRRFHDDAGDFEGEDYYDPETETRILGLMLYSDDSLALVDDVIGPESFAKPGNSRLYAKLREMIRNGIPRTLETLQATDNLVRQDYLFLLLAEATTTLEVRGFARCLQRQRKVNEPVAASSVELTTDGISPEKRPGAPFSSTQLASLHHSASMPTNERNSMPYEQEDLTGALFKNTRKSEDKHADSNGSITVDGREFYLDAWLKDAKSGGKFMSLRLRPKAKANYGFGDSTPF